MIAEPRRKRNWQNVGVINRFHIKPCSFRSRRQRTDQFIGDMGDGLTELYF
jgi:hypothetical protein